MDIYNKIIGGKLMKKIWLLKIFGICLLLFITIFLVANVALASNPDVRTRPSISFSDINESAEYIQWEIKANENYKVQVNMVDEDGNKFSISFNTNDYYEEYDTSDNNALIVRIGDDDDYADGSKKIYTSKFFSYLTSKHLSENNDITYNYTNEATVRTIIITGLDFSLYSITLDDNDNFDGPCWERDASDWDDLDDFESDDGKISTLADQYIQFNNSNIHVTKKIEPNYPVNYPYPISYLSPPSPNYFGYQQPYNPYRYQQAYSPSGWNQPYNYSGSPNYYPDRYAVPVNPQNPYGAYTSLPTVYSGYHGNPYNPSDPLYGTVPRPNLSLPSEIMNMLLSSNYETGQRGYELSLPYFQADMMSGWTPWSSPYGSQAYNRYGGYPPVSPSWPPAGMAYNPLSGSFYIPGQYYPSPGQY